MFDPTAIAALVQQGGWAVVVAMILGLGVGFVRGWLVPGWMYRRLESRLLRFEAGQRKLIRAVEKLAEKRQGA